MRKKNDIAAVPAKEKGKMKSIRKELTNKVCLLVAFPLIALGLLSVYLLMTSAMTSLEQTVLPLVEIAAADVHNTINTHINVAQEVGTLPELSDPSVSTDAKKQLIDARAQMHGYQRGNILDIHGKSIFDGNDYSTREYYIHAMQRQSWISEPLTSKVTGATTLIVASPIWKDGVYASSVSGVVYFVPKETFLNDIVSSVHISENSYAYMLDKNGNIIAHEDMQNVAEQVNHIALAKADASYAKLAEIETAMIQGYTGFATYSNGNQLWLAAYTPVEGTNGWSLAVTAPLNDFLLSTYEGIFFTVGLLIFAMIAAMLIMRRIAARICDPVAKCTERLETLAQGDLTSEVPVFNRRDEIGRLSDATATIVSQISGVINDLSTNLDNISEGDFTCEASDPSHYIGDYAALKSAIDRISHHLSHTMWQISTTADQVAIGSDQVAAGAQILSSGAVTQATSIDQLAHDIGGITDRIRQTAEHAENASNKVGETGELMVACSAQMSEMLAAMDEIGQNSQQIGDIIRTIEDIAFQTNILALNAAVEAARAGDAGKGFAVVADEVRNLAGKSAEASQVTSALISAAIDSVTRGRNIANSTAATLERVSENSNQTADMVNEIAVAAQQQSETIERINQGVDEISTVVQHNSASSEESAASSAEMSSQAQMLKSLVEQFKLRIEQEEL